MLEMMEFPETVEEFMDEYKIIDSDEVYTNGAALVPIFRMNQWFDHMKGMWMDKGSLSCRCSECGCKNNKETAFCPNCGAQMKVQMEKEASWYADQAQWGFYRCTSCDYITSKKQIIVRTVEQG